MPDLAISPASLQAFSTRPVRTWTLPTFLEAQVACGLLHPDDCALAEAAARAWWFFAYLLEDFPAEFTTHSSAEMALLRGATQAQQRREGVLPLPRDGGAVS